MKRVKVTGDLFHGKIPEGAVYIGRGAPGLKASPYRNPFTLKKHGAAAQRLFVEYLDARQELVEQARRELTGKDLACWCAADAPWCHADEWIRRFS